MSLNRTYPKAPATINTTKTVAIITYPVFCIALTFLYIQCTLQDPTNCIRTIKATVKAPRRIRKAFRSLPSFTPQRIRVDLIAISTWVMSNIKVGRTSAIWMRNEKMLLPKRPPVNSPTNPGFTIPYPEIAKIMKKINVGQTSRRLNLFKSSFFSSSIAPSRQSPYDWPHIKAFLNAVEKRAANWKLWNRSQNGPDPPTTVRICTRVNSFFRVWYLRSKGECLPSNPFEPALAINAGENSFFSLLFLLQSFLYPLSYLFARFCWVGIV